MMMSVRMAPPLPLIFLLMFHSVSSAGLSVRYSSSHICALKHSLVIMRCTYTYPPGIRSEKVFWTKNLVKDVEPPDLSKDLEYRQRFQYLGDKQKNCTMRLSHVTQKDEHKYYFRFITDKDKWIGHPGVTLTVTDLQVESPERVTEGDSVRLTCKSSCALTDRATFIWYRNSQPLTERRDRNNILLLQSVRREDAGRYSCALQEHTYISPEVHLNVMYPPRNVSVFMNGSGEIVEGDSVTLICSSDSNPPALNFFWFKENQSSSVGSGQSFSALQSGRFYCEAHNQHGSQRSDAVSVTVKGRLVILYISIGAVCGAAVIIVMMLIWSRIVNRNDTQESQMNHPMSRQDIHKACDVQMDEPVYENVRLDKKRPYSHQRLKDEEHYRRCHLHEEDDEHDAEELGKKIIVLLKFVRMAAAILIYLLMIHGVSSVGWSVRYNPSHICALKNSSVIMNCTYTYPPGHHIKKVFWIKTLVKESSEEKYEGHPNLFKDPEYSQRFQYLGDKQKNCTMRLSHVTQKDEHKYYFRFITDKDKWIGLPGVTLTVTDLQVESPERVTEGDSVRLTCKSSCALTDRATFIWYRNSQPLTERRDRNNILLLQSVRREDAGRYSCDVQERNHYLRSPAVYLNVMYAPKYVSLYINPSGEIMEGGSVTLICSSDSNPPAEISWFKGKTLVRSGRIYDISKIRSDHSGEYKCKSRNKHGEKYSEAVTLNVMYPPRNVSMSIQSGLFWEGDSVTLICSSDSNPPALNFFWFKENQSSSVGSGQSFSALQSGRFYCEAHNQHGSQRSDAVSVTVKGRPVILYISIGAVCGAAVIIILLILRNRWIKNKNGAQMNYSRPRDAGHKACNAESTDPVYENVTAPTLHGSNIHKPEPDSVYENIPY
ncbi:LOW QUALITY PROTEIN: sialic acid-binding Ig-like lectin 5 [Puntigrus tetrazona]|uniref:LOW QUALITY PROTEIN: sialic acid-binding Ig-like lectin 5 n=1 Tax=Puntigrus tetrazona TaxID=1606681 RepID=UPI001C89C880|nr:LOW QUALITY PROTEIN: sialic acid-binding Ig-like lectin 5 [Puntigrus tetrazona]